MKFIKPKRTIPASPATNIGFLEDKIFKYFVSYAILISYVLASVSSTTDLMLLQATEGLKLPFMDHRVSIRGFYSAAPLIIAAASLYMAREFSTLSTQKQKQSRKTDFVFSVSEENPSGKILGVNGRLDAIIARFFSYCIFFLLGPVVLLIITIRFADYQDKIIFPLHLVIFAITTYLSWVFYRRVENIFHKTKTPLSLKFTGITAAVIIGIKFLVCLDVIFSPPKYSFTMYVKQHTDWLENFEGGASSIIPHLSIDRTSPIWTAEAKDHEEFSFYNHSKNPRDYFYSRSAGVDLRGRSLKYLDISFQIAPRIWAHNADLSGANLSFTRIPGSNFINTNLYGANLSMSVLDGSRFFAAELEKTNIVNSYFRGTIFDNTIFSHSLLRYVDLTGASFFGARIQESVLDGVNFSGAEFLETKIINSSMIIDDPSPIFPSQPSSKNEFGEFSDAFREDEEAALAAIVEQFCKKSLSASDEIALKGITDTYLMMARVNGDRILKLKKKLSDLSCDKAIEFIPDKNAKR